MIRGLADLGIDEGLGLPSPQVARAAVICSEPPLYLIGQVAKIIKKNYGAAQRFFRREAISGGAARRPDNFVKGKGRGRGGSFNLGHLMRSFFPGGCLHAR